MLGVPDTKALAVLVVPPAVLVFPDVRVRRRPASSLVDVLKAGDARHAKRLVLALARRRRPVVLFLARKQVGQKVVQLKRLRTDGLTSVPADSHKTPVTPS